MTAKHRLTQKWFVLERSKDGLLKEPRNKWDDALFNNYGYRSKEEAVEEIEVHGDAWGVYLLVEGCDFTFD